MRLYKATVCIRAKNYETMIEAQNRDIAYDKALDYGYSLLEKGYGTFLSGVIVKPVYKCRLIRDK